MEFVLHCTLPCSPGISYFLLHIFSFLSLSLSLSYTNTCEHTCLCVHRAYSLHVNGNPWNLLKPPSDTFDDHSPILRRWSHLSHLSHVHSSRPLVSSVCHLNQSRAHSYSHSCSSNLSSFILIITLFSAEILLLVSSHSAIRRTIY